MTATTKCFGALVLVALIAGILGTALQTNADSAFNFKDSFGIYLNDGSTPVPIGMLVQLVWTADFAYHPAQQGLLDAAGYLTSGDYILFQGATDQLGGWFTDLDGAVTYDASDTGGTYIPSGWVYGRVFATNANPLLNCFFLQSTLVPVANEQTNPIPDIPDVVDMAPGGGSGPGGASVMNMQVIPEPASLAIFGMGLMSIVMWRLRKR